MLCMLWHGLQRKRNTKVKAQPRAPTVQNQEAAKHGITAHKLPDGEGFKCPTCSTISEVRAAIMRAGLPPAL